MNKELERTEEILHKSLKELNDKGDLNNMSIDLLGKTVDALKDISEIKEKESHSYGRGGWTAEGSYGAGRRGMDGDGDGRYYEGRYGRYDRYDNYGRMY